MKEEHAFKWEQLIDHIITEATITCDNCGRSETQDDYEA